MILSDLNSKNTLLMFIILISVRPIHSRPRKCLWDFLYEAFFGDEILGEETNAIAPTVETVEICDAEDAPEKKIDKHDGGDGKQTHISNIHISIPLTEEKNAVSSYSFVPLIHSNKSIRTSAGGTANYFDFYFAMNFADSKEPRLAASSNKPPEVNSYLTFYCYSLAVAISIIVLMTEYFFYKKFQELQKTVNNLARRFDIQDKDFEHSSDDIEEFYESENDVSRLTFFDTSKWTAEKVFYHLKQLAIDAVAEIPDDDKNIYLDDAFLREIANYIADQESLKENLELLAPKALLRLGRFYHHLTRIQEDGEKELKVNVGVYVTDETSEKKATPKLTQEEKSVNTGEVISEPNL